MWRHPRDQLIDNLNQQLNVLFGTGKKIEQIAPGVSGGFEGMLGTSHSNKLRLERDKLAPRLKAVADKGMTAI